MGKIIPLDLQRIKADIQSNPLIHQWVKEVLLFDDVDSTNQIGMQMGLEGAEGGALILAEGQNKGRGRLDRTWVSPKCGNLYLSLLIRPNCPTRDFPLFSLAAAVALVNAIRSAAGLSSVIKWPNDILLGDKKVAGILLESGGNGKASFLVIGIGVNVNWDMNAMPQELNATSLKTALGRPLDRNGLMIDMLQALVTQFDLLVAGEKGRIIQSVSEVCATLGKSVMIHTPRQTLQGVAKMILEDGGLLLRLEDGTEKKVLVGDVTHAPGIGGK